MTLGTYLPQDRLRALVRDESLPERTSGAALFADISGFTRLTETLRESMGPRRGAEELTRHLNAVYTALINEVENDGGSVIGFAGDAITCWFDDSHGPAASRAVHCAFALQEAMNSFPVIVLPNGTRIPLALKVTVATGPIRRFAVGDPSIRYLDTLVGATVTRASTAEHLAGKGEVLVDEATAQSLGNWLSIREWRQEPTTAERFAVVTSFAGTVTAPTLLPAQQPPNDRLQPWVSHALYEREQAGQETFLTEFRPCVAMFVRFLGIDYESDEAWGQLDALIKQIQACAERHEGTLLQVTIGDKGSYAYVNFGAVSAHENDARRAVKTALDLKRTAEGLGFLEPLQIGITQGVMRVGTCGGSTRREYCALGDDVNLAARLMTIAAPGEILISGRLRKAITGDFVIVEARPSIPIKGKADLLPVFAILGTEQQRAFRLQEPAYALMIIGRNRELAWIESKLGSVLQGQGQIIGVTAEAGMGKSRLVAEGIRMARKNRLIGYGGSCQSDGTSTPYLVWHTVWNAFFDLDPAAPLRKQIRNLEGELEERVPEHVDALPLLGAVLGLSLPENDYTRPLQPRDRKTQLETMLVKCLESAAREAAEDGGGLLLVLEDLHWIDPVSFDLLELVARAIEHLPVLVLLTYRPVDASLQDKSLTRLESLAHFSQIQLAELNAQETEQVIRSKLFHLYPERGGRIPRLLVERITGRAQGNPFYVEELLNYLHDRGIDLEDTQALEKLELPASLYSLILSRIDQLTNSQQLTLKVASIIGRIFRFDDLQNYYPALSTAGRLKADMHELERLELTPLDTPEPELTYLFKHLVTHEVGYESLSFATRAQLHGQYARYLESAYPGRTDQLAPQLAHHFERAHIQDKARFYLTKAGEQAAANFANEEALTYFNRALELTTLDDPQGRFGVLLLREAVYDLQGKHTEQRHDLQELARLAGQLEEAPSLRARVAVRQAKMEIDVGEYTAAISSAQAAVQEIEADGSSAQASELLVDALYFQGRAMFLAGQTQAARSHLEQALNLSRQLQYVRGEYNALAQLGMLSWNGGDYASATHLLQQSLEQIRKAGDIRRELEILNNLGVVAKARSQFSEAIDCYERAQRIARKIGDRSGEATLLANMGSVCLVSGDFVLAGSYSEQAANMAVDVKELALQGMALTNLGEAYRELGRYDLARATAEQALALLRSSQYRRGEAIVLDNLGLIEFSLGNHARAQEWMEAAREIARESGPRFTEASALLHLGAVYTETGRLEPAEQVLSEAQQMFEEMEEELSLLEVHARLADLLLIRGASDALEAADAHLSELISLLLQEPAHEKTRFLPLWLYLPCLRVLQARRDPRLAQMIGRAQAELEFRSHRIADNALRTGYLSIPEHAAILDRVRAFSSTGS